MNSNDIDVTVLKYVRPETRTITMPLRVPICTSDGTPDWEKEEDEEW